MPLLFAGRGFRFVVRLLLGRDLYVYKRQVRARRDLQRGVLHIGSFLAEDCPQQTLFRREFCFAFGRNLADQNVARLHLCANANDTVGSKVSERLIAQVRNVARDLFGAELGVAGADLELIDVDGSKDVVLNDALADEDGVFKVVAVPWHEGDQHVAAECQFAALSAGAIGNDLALLDRLALLDNDFLVDTGGGVGPHELPNLVDVNALLGIVLKLLLALGQFSVFGNDDLIAGERCHFASLLGDDDRPRVTVSALPRPGGTARPLVAGERPRVALHVGPKRAT